MNKITFEIVTDLDTRSEACQRFFREGLTISFTKILTDEAVSGWKYEIHVSVQFSIEMRKLLCVYFNHQLLQVSLNLFQMSTR